jgi:hypothetical protein
MTARRRSRRRQGQAVAAVALTALAVAAAVTMLHVIGWVAATAAVGAACWYAGRRSFPRIPRTRTRTRAPANARSLAQLNRHLNERLDIMQAKLEVEMARADRAEESARAARDTAADRPAAWHATNGTAPRVRGTRSGQEE